MKLPTKRLGVFVVAFACSGACQPLGQEAALAPPPRDRAAEFSPTGHAALVDLMNAAVRDGGTTGAIGMLARDGRVVWLETAGEMRPGTPMRDDAIMPLASAGKMHTAVAAMILAERRVITLDDPVSRYIPEFADVRVEATGAGGASQRIAPEWPVTIRHLLTHTGGLTVSGDAFWAAWNEHSDRTTATDFARALARLPLRSQPGARFEYGPTGASYEVLGAVIEIASGQTLEAFMTENIFRPLGLIDTCFHLPEAKSARRPAFYRKQDGRLVPDRPPEAARSAYFHGGGGVQSSPQDVLRFARLFLEGGAVDGVRVLRPETVQLMMTDHVGSKSPLPDGLGWGFGAAVKSTASGTAAQFGWVGGGHTILWVDPGSSLVAYFAIPVSPPGDPALLDEFRRRTYGAMSGPRPAPGRP